MTFTDEDGNPRQFTWRTIQTWLVRYNKHGVTALRPQGRSDKGKLRKVCLEEVMEAVRTVLPSFQSAHPPKQAVYRACIEQGLLQRDRVVPNTFSRIVDRYEMFKTDEECTGKRRLAFAKAHANEMWQADTMFGPYVTDSLPGTFTAFPHPNLHRLKGCELPTLPSVKRIAKSASC